MVMLNNFNEIRGNASTMFYCQTVTITKLLLFEISFSNLFSLLVDAQFSFTSYAGFIL